ncbi:unnamed protein product [marine sediment metagenome]|uniref:Sister chromatid cohesion C-terminal domain-containing protein n=1 Tax=marine sediment metagenome TaxID=412755 RepID=X1EUY2_9ZZZZ
MGDQDAGAAIFSSILQTNLTAVLGLVLDSDAAARREAVLLLDVVLRQGLLNPLQAVPHLMAAIADSEAQVWMLRL